jgi:dephospho-CoA kinase
VIFVVPLLVESRSGRRCDRVLVVDCPVDTQIARVMQRNGFTRGRSRRSSRDRRRAKRAWRCRRRDRQRRDDARRAGHWVDALHQRYLAFAAAKH